MKNNKMMKNINWKIFNFALGVEIILAYFLPFRVEENFKYQVGFPIPFLTIYDTAIGVNPFHSMHVNPFVLLFNVILFYFIIFLGVKIFTKVKKAVQNKQILSNGLNPHKD